MNGISHVLFPQPLDGISGAGYRVRVAEAGGGPRDYACSDGFFLSASTASDVPGPGKWGEPSITVVSPYEGAVAFAGDEYTVEVSHFTVPRQELRQGRGSLHWEGGLGVGRIGCNHHAACVQKTSYVCSDVTPHAAAGPCYV